MATISETWIQFEYHNIKSDRVFVSLLWNSTVIGWGVGTLYSNDPTTQVGILQPQTWNDKANDKDKDIKIVSIDL